MFITNVTENKFSKSPDEQGLVCGHWGTSHPLTPLSGHNWSERTACSKYTNTNTNTNTQTHSLLATSDGLYLIRACSLARASTSRGGEVCIRFVFALVKRISMICFLFEETEKLTCRTRHASQRHYHKTFGHRSHTPEEVRKSLKEPNWQKLTL